MKDLRIGAVIAAAALLGGAIAGIWAGSQPERYEVDVVMAIGPASTLADQTAVIDVTSSLDRGGIIATAAGIAASSGVRAAAVADAGFAEGTAGDYKIDSLPVLNSTLIDITVSGPDADATAALANAVGAQLQGRFQTIYPIYQVELLTPAVAPTHSSRPSSMLIILLGAIATAAIAAAALWSAFGGRWRGAGATGTP